MTVPRCCICIPTFNSAATLGATLQSVLTQTHQNLIVKIFDNASTDSTLAVATSFQEKDARIQIYTSDVNLGGERNFTRCLQAAEGDYTAIYHSDDLYHPTIVEESVAFLEKHRECGAVAVHSLLIDENARITGERFLPNELRSQRESVLDEAAFLELVSRYGNFVTCPSVMARSELYRNKIAQWNGHNFKTSADLDIWWRITQVSRLGILTKPLMSYRVSKASFTVRETKRRISRHDFFLVVDKMCETHPVMQSPAAKTHIEFLEFKDIALRRLNIIRSKASVPLPRFQGSWLSLLKTGLTSSFHCKFLIVGVLLYALTSTFGTFRNISRRGQP